MRFFLRRMMCAFLITSTLCVPTTSGGSSWGWPIVAGLGVAVCGKLLGETISNYHERSLLQDDKDSISDVERLSRSMGRSYDDCAQSVQSIKKLTRAVLAIGEPEHVIATFRTDLGRFERAISKLETNCRRWKYEDQSSAESFYERGREALRDAHPVASTMKRVEQRLVEGESFIQLYSLVMSEKEYRAPRDPFASITLADELDRDCRAIARAIEALECRGTNSAEEDHLIRDAQIKIRELRAHRDRIIQSDDYRDQQRLKLYDERQQEIIDTQRRIACASEQRAQAEIDRAHEATQLRIKLERIEAHLREIRRRSYEYRQAPSLEFHVWLEGELADLI